MIRFNIVTVFPDVIENYCNASILGRAQKQQHVSITAHNLRNWTTDKHHVVDDRVFGGGAGMLLKVEPLWKAITELKQKAVSDGFTPKVLATVAHGDLFTQTMAEQFAVPDQSVDYIILCGHYEGFDERVFELVDQKVTVGPYILTGGELPALIVIDAVTRLLPGVLGNEESAEVETSFEVENNVITVNGEYPQYTMPAAFTFTDDNGVEQTRVVPEIYRSGHHKNIKTENESKRVKKILTSS